MLFSGTALCVSTKLLVEKQGHKMVQGLAYLQTQAEDTKEGHWRQAVEQDQKMVDLQNVS